MSKVDHTIVIGAGIVGVSTALWLQRSGVRVTLVDREGFAAGTSYGNAGVLAASAVVPVTVPGLLKKAPGMLFSGNEPLFLRWSYLPQLLPFLFKYLSYANADDVKRIGKGLAEVMYDTVDQHMALAKGTPAERFIRAGDYVHAYDNKHGFEKDAFAWRQRRDLGFEDEELDQDALANYDPELAGKFGYAVRCPNHGQITDPGEYVGALGGVFLDQGGQLVVADVTNITTENGIAKAVETSEGQIEADQVVITSGAWSSMLCAKLGAKIPMEAERGYHVEFVNANVSLRSNTMVSSKKFAMNSMDGRLRCAGIVEFGGLDAGPSKAPIELLKRNAHEIFPNLEYDSTREWLGHRPSTPDSLPVIGALKNASNVWAGFGHQHLGLTGGPKTGRWLAQLITGEKPNVDMTPYAPDRF
ncbi:MAG: FAD-dependent oxidoreductase [Rhizobiaceae bacterium]|nr:FAD-dependent oxidoreductase [Rhizobiaceae bacterium]